MNKKFKLSLVFLLIFANLMVISGCSCSKVNVNIEGGKIVDSPKNIQKGDMIELECSNSQNFGYWYVEELKPLSYDCKQKFEISDDVTFKAAPIEHFLIVGFNEEILSSNTTDLQTKVPYSELLISLEKNIDVTDYALYSFTNASTTNIIDKGISLETSGSYSGLYVQKFEVKLYVPQNCVFRLYKVVLDSDGMWNLVQIGFASSDNITYGNKQNETSAVSMHVVVSSNSSDSYK